MLTFVCFASRSIWCGIEPLIPWGTFIYRLEIIIPWCIELEVGIIFRVIEVHLHLHQCTQQSLLPAVCSPNSSTSRYRRVTKGRTQPALYCTISTYQRRERTSNLSEHCQPGTQQSDTDAYRRQRSVGDQAARFRRLSTTAVSGTFM